MHLICIYCYINVILTKDKNPQIFPLSEQQLLRVFEFSDTHILPA